MRMPFLGLLVAVLVGSSTGCATMFNSHAFISGPVVEQDAAKQVDVEPLRVLASASGPDRIDLVVTQADGKVEHAILKADGRAYLSKSRWREVKAPYVPISRTPILEGDGLSLVGGTVRWIKAGRVVTHLRLARTKYVEQPRRNASGLAKAWHYTKHLLFVPLALAIDAATWPIQLITFPHFFFI